MSDDLILEVPGAIDFATLLDLDTTSDDQYRGWCHQGSPMRAFGGHLAAQGFVAAGTTVPGEYRPASIHAYFASAANSEAPVDYLVTQSRDGRSFTTRSVTAVQRGRTVLILLASFHRPEPGPSRQRRPEPVPAPPAAAPDGARSGRASIMERAIEQYVPSPAGDDDDPGVGHHRRWMRARLPIGDDPVLQAGALIYMTDMVLPMAAVQPHAERSPGVLPTASLDHAVWFHGTIRAEKWLLLAAHSPVLAGSRGLAIAHVYDETGRLVASAAQDVLARQLDAG